MKPFAAKLRNGQQFLGLGLSTADILRLKAGEAVSLELSAIDVGLWFKDAEGKRSFLQPRDSYIVVVPGDSTEDIGCFLNVKLASDD